MPLHKFLERVPMTTPFWWVAFLATWAAVAGCPAELIRPCVCVGDANWKQAQCANFTSVSALQDVIDQTSDRPIRDFMLLDSNLMFVKASWIGGKNMLRFTVKNSILNSLFDEAPATNNMLIEFYMWDVRVLRGIQWEHFRPLSGLKEIEVSGVEIGQLGKEFENGMAPNLWKFMFKGTKTSSLGDTVFSQLKEMYGFIFSDSRLKTLKRSMFPNPTPLVAFNVRNNRIEFLPNDMFQGMNNMMNIDMSGNRLATVSENVFGGLFNGNLFYLNVEDNPLTCDCRIAWTTSTTRQLTKVGVCISPADMKGRSIEQLTKEDFRYCPRTMT